jgi:large subunit ribosomal protein L15
MAEPKQETEETKETKKPAAAKKPAEAAKPAEGENASANAERIGLHNLSPADGSRSSRKRVGRGHGSGHGKTSGRGHKGAGQRAGRKHNVAYEGGQTPIQMRMRKLRGPHMKKSMPFEKFRTHTQQVNVSDLEERFAAGSEVTPETLKANGLAKRPLPVKILGNGEITKSLKVAAHGFSASAREKIEGAGGSCETIEG